MKINGAYAAYAGPTWLGQSSNIAAECQVFGYPGSPEWACVHWRGDHWNLGLWGSVVIEAEAAAMMLAVEMNDQALFGNRRDRWTNRSF